MEKDLYALEAFDLLDGRYINDKIQQKMYIIKTIFIINKT